MPISVAIVDDDDLLRDSLVRVLKRADGFTCAGVYNSGAVGLEGLTRDRADVVLMDINMPDMNGVECVRRLKEFQPATQVIMLTVYEDTETIFNALAAGASGYLLKNTPKAQLLEGIREVHGGGSPMSNHIARIVVQSFQKAGPSAVATENLSPREQQVLEHLAKGYLYKEIAEALNISFGSVHTYIRRIYEKLHVRSRSEALAKFYQKPGSDGRPPSSRWA